MQTAEKRRTRPTVDPETVVNEITRTHPGRLQVPRKQKRNPERTQQQVSRQRNDLQKTHERTQQKADPGRQYLVQEKLFRTQVPETAEIQKSHENGGIERNAEAGTQTAGRECRNAETQKRAGRGRITQAERCR